MCINTRKGTWWGRSMRDHEVHYVNDADRGLVWEEVGACVLTHTGPAGGAGLCVFNVLDSWSRMPA